MTLFYCHNKKRNITYVYYTECYSDDSGQETYHRKLIGKLDPETGDIIPTGSPGRPPVKSISSDIPYNSLEESLNKTKADLNEIKTKLYNSYIANEKLKEENTTLIKLLREIKSILNNIPE